MTNDELKQAHDNIPNDTPINKARRAAILREIARQQKEERHGNDD